MLRNPLKVPPGDEQAERTRREVHRRMVAQYGSAAKTPTDKAKDGIGLLMLVFVAVCLYGLGSVIVHLL
jgi:hypothetical protein